MIGPTFTAAAANTLTIYAERIGVCLDRLTPEQIWARASTEENAIGNLVLRVISARRGKEMASALRQNGYAVTTFTGEGRFGPVTEVLVVCPRRKLGAVLEVVRGIEPDAFYITESTSSVSRLGAPTNLPADPDPENEDPVTLRR